MLLRRLYAFIAVAGALACAGAAPTDLAGALSGRWIVTAPPVMALELALDQRGGRLSGDGTASQVGIDGYILPVKTTGTVQDSLVTLRVDGAAFGLHTLTGHLQSDGTISALLQGPRVASPLRVTLQRRPPSL